MGEPGQEARDLLATIERDADVVFSRLVERLHGTEAGNGRPPLLHSLAELLSNPDALRPPQPVIPRLAYRSRVTLLAGREKLSGKSTLLTAGAAAVTRGAHFLGEPCAAGPALWVTADREHASEIVGRAVRFDADPAHFHVLWPGPEPFGDLAAAVARVAPLVVVLDTLANFAHVEDPHSAAQWPGILLPLVQLARDRDLAVAIAHHSKKNDGGGYRDSSAIGALVDLLLELQADAGNPGWPAANFAIELVGDRYELVAGAALSLDARVLVLIEQHPGCSQQGVRDAIGGRADEVNGALGRLLGSGAIRDAGGGNRHKYEIATRSPEAAAEDDHVPL